MHKVSLKQTPPRLGASSLRLLLPGLVSRLLASDGADGYLEMSATSTPPTSPEAPSGRRVIEDECESAGRNPPPMMLQV